MNGENWTCLNNSIKFSNPRFVKIIKNNGKNRIFVAANGPSACWYSDDEGFTWTKSAGLDKPGNWGSMQKGAYVDAINRIFILTNEWDYSLNKQQTCVYYSDDYGENFTKLYQSGVQPAPCDIWTPAGTSTDLFFAHLDTLSLIDSGLNRTVISNFDSIPGFKKVTNILMNGGSGKSCNYIYVMMNNGDGKSYFCRSTDSGKNWELMGNLGYGAFDKNSFGVSKLLPDNIYFGGVEVNRSEDGGKSWARVNKWGDYYPNPKTMLHADIPCIHTFASSDSTEITLIGTDGGLYRSDDYAKTVNNLSMNDLNVSQYYSTYTYMGGGAIVYAGSQDQGFQRCLEDSGGTLGFRQTISGDYGHLCSSDGGVNVWSVYPGFAMLYLDANKDNHKTYMWDFNKNKCQNWLWMPPTMPNPYNPKSVYVAAGGVDCANTSKCSYIFRLIFDSTGITHTQMPFNFGWDGSRLSAMAYSEINTDYIYCLTSKGRFYYSSTKGESFDSTENFKGPDAHYFYGSSILPSKKKLGRLYIAGSSYSNCGFWVSNDHGMTFSKADSGLPATLIHKIAMSEDENYIFAATEAGPYVYVVPQKRWFDMSNAISPDQNFWSVEYLPNTKTVRFATYGRGIWDFKVDEFITEVKENEEFAAAGLRANPNILNSGVTNIEVGLSKSAVIDLSVYDYEGKMVKKIFSGIAEPRQLFQWDGSSEASTQLPSGTYLAILSSNGIVKFCKINIIK